MAMKTTTSSGAVGLRRSLRRRHKPQMLAPLKVRKPTLGGGGLQLAALLAKRERRQAVRQRQREHQDQTGTEQTEQTEQEQDGHLETVEVEEVAAPSSSSSSSHAESSTLSMLLRHPSPAASATSTSSSSASRPSSANTDGLHYIFGRYFDDNDRSAADILATLYYSGVLCTRKPVEDAAGCSPEVVERDHMGSPPLSPRFALPIDGDSVKVCDVALPSMQQTNIMLESWHSDSRKSSSARTISTARVGADLDDEADQSAHDSTRTASFSSFSSTSSSPSSYPLTPGLSLGSGASSARSSFSSVATEAAEPFPASNAPRRWSTSPADRPFASYEQSYFSSSPAPKQQTYPSPQSYPLPTQSHLHGMPSPPQSPTDIGRLSEYCWKPQTATPTSTQNQTQAQTQMRQEPAYPSQFSQFHFQYPTPTPPTLPRPYFQASSNTAPALRPLDSIATTVVTLPPAGALAARAASGVPPLTPLTPMAPGSSSMGLASSAGRSSPIGPLSSPLSADSLVSRKRKFSSAATSPSASSPVAAASSGSSSSPPASTARHHVPRPHCNVKYETAELDFIMYQRCTKNRAWDDVTASFNAALPRLRHYAEMDGTLGALDASGSCGANNSMAAGGAGSAHAAAKGIDRYRPRPERTTPGLQASYYRQRLALPLLDEAGRLVFDDQTNKQMFTEVMVRDDKSRKRRRLHGAAATTSATTTPATKSDDARVHLVLYFPERVAHYDYWFVTAEDKALARQRAYERNLQRAQRGLPPWQPGSDDPETGILIRNKE